MEGDPRNKTRGGNRSDVDEVGAQFIWCMRPRYEMFGQLEMGRTGQEMDCKKIDNIYQWLVLWLVGGSHRKALMRQFQRMGTCVVYNPPLKRKTWYVDAVWDELPRLLE